MTSRLKTMLLISAFTVGCASCVSTCGEEEQKPHAVNVSGKPGSSVMHTPRVLQARDMMDAAGGTPPTAP